MATTPRPQTSPMVAELLSIGVLRLSADNTTILTPSGAAYTLSGAQVAAATTAAAGVVRQAAALANIAADPTQADFNALLTRLRTAGLMAP